MKRTSSVYEKKLNGDYEKKSNDDGDDKKEPSTLRTRKSVYEKRPIHVKRDPCDDENALMKQMPW